MYSRILKNSQVSVGNPFKIKVAYDKSKLLSDEAFEEQACTAMIDDPETLLNELREKAEQQAALIINEAKLEAKRIIDDAEAECKKRVHAIEEEARERGYETGSNEAKIQYEDLINQAEAIKADARTEYIEFTKSIESSVMKMIIDIAKKVIYDEVHLNRENVLMLVRQAFEKCTYKENLVLNVSDIDYEHINENKDKLLEMLGGVEELDIRKDLSLKSGSCIVETPFGTIDTGVDTKLRKIEEAFGCLIGSQN